MAKRKIPTEIPMEKITDPDQYGFYGISLDPEQRVFRDAIWNPNIDVVICSRCSWFRQDAYCDCDCKSACSGWLF